MKKLKSLHEGSTLTWLFHATLNWCELAVIIYVISFFKNPIGFWLGSLVLGVRMHGLALLGHEGIHKTISKHLWLNEALTSFLCAYPIMQSIELFRWFHLAHHQHLGDSANDPEFAFRAKTPNRWSTPISKGKVFRLLVLDLVGIGVWEARHVIFGNKDLKASYVLQPLVFWIGVWFVFYRLEQLWIPALWTFSLFTSYWASFRLRALSEHLDTDNTHRFHAKPIERYLFMPHNCWYHYEHHIWPKIPFYKLPEARKLDRKVPVMPTAFHYF